MTVAELMGRYCQGDAEAFQALYDEVAPCLRGYLIRLCKDPEAADELLQVTFMKVHRARSQYLRGANPVPWIYSIGHRCYLDALRQRKRARVFLVADGDWVPELRAGFTGAAEDPAATSPDATLMEKVLNALGTLPHKQREALVLTKLRGQSIAEAAALSGATIGAIKLRIRRGSLRLRAMLDAGRTVSA